MATKAAKGKALMAKLRADPKVRDAEALGAWIGRKKRYKKMGLSSAVARDLAGKLGGSEVAKSIGSLRGPKSQKPRKRSPKFTDKQRERLAERNRQIHNRNVERQRREAERERVRAEKEERQRERYEERLIREQEKAERKRFFSAIMELGGIKSHRDSALREEYQGIPNTYKRRDGLTGDDMAEHLARYYPEFGIENERDLIEFFTAA